MKSILPFLFVLCFNYAKAQETNGPLNVLFFVVDDLRPTLGCYGDDVVFTPNIDALASRGVLFSRAYCQQAVCNPSRASMLTGLRPDESGVVNLQKHFRDKVPDAVTLPQLYKNNGYYSLSVGKIFHTESSTLDTISWSVEIPNPRNANYLLPENKGGGDPKKNVVEAADVDDIAYADGKIAVDAIRLLSDAHAKGQPFFLGVGFNKPHAPFCAPKKYWDLYDGIEFDIPNKQRPEGSPELAFHASQELRGYRDVPAKGSIPSDKEQEIRQGYYASISYVDAQIGKVLHHLDSLGLGENTIIVLWGDHGYHLGEQDLWCKSTNFELSTRVPLIIAAPNMGGNGQVTDAIVETVDIYPTLVELSDLKIENRLTGTSLRPLLGDTQSSWKRPAFSQFVRPYNAIFIKNTPIHMGYTVRVPGWRCTYWYDIESGAVVEKELYQLDETGMAIETENVAGMAIFSEVEVALSGLLTDYKKGKYN